MNDTCTTHRSRVPRRSFGRVKWGVTTVEDERGPGLGFSLCFVCGSRPWGAAAFLLCLFIWLLNVFKCSPVPASFLPYISTALHWCRNPGGRRDTLSESPRCWGGSRCWGDRAAGSSGDRQWLPEAVVLEQKKNRWDGRLAAVLLGRGGVAVVREGAEESPRSPGGRSLLPSAMFGEKLLRGTRDRWVVQVSFITNYSTGLAPFPRLSAPPHSSQLFFIYFFLLTTFAHSVCTTDVFSNIVCEMIMPMKCFEI